MMATTKDTAFSPPQDTTSSKVISTKEPNMSPPSSDSADDASAAKNGAENVSNRNKQSQKGQETKTATKAKTPSTSSKISNNNKEPTMTASSSSSSSSTAAGAETPATKNDAENDTNLNKPSQKGQETKATTTTKAKTPSAVAHAQGSSSFPSSYSSSLSGSSGLSELSKQLRLLQCKNQSQALEIDRLERQLRILADLQNVSVADLRRTLQDACQQEARGELETVVASLRAQLEAATLLSKEKSGPQAMTNNDATTQKLQHEIATLQLRVGELEELDQERTQEIRKLYQQLKEQTAKATRLEHTCQQQQAELEQWRRQQQQNSQIVPYQPPTPNPAAVEVQIQHQQAALAEQQLQGAQKDHELRQAQFKARLVVQDERIQDLEQQLSSLYTAFQLLRQERTDEEKTRMALQSNLHEADAQVARGLEEKDRHWRGVATTTTTGPSSAASLSTTAAATTTTNNNAAPRRQAAAAPQQSPSSPQQSSFRSTSSRSVLVSPSPSSPSTTTATSPSPSLSLSPLSSSTTAATTTKPKGDCILQGPLLVRSSGMRRQWKKRHAALYVSFAQYQLVLSGSPYSGALPAPDKQYTAPVGASRLEEYRKHDWAFVLHVNHSTVLYLAATQESDYFAWMSALTRVTVGPEDFDNNNNNNNGISRSTSVASSSRRRQQQQVPSEQSAVEQQEASDLERALRLSTREL